MPERELDLGKTPDRPLEPTLTTVDKLVFTYNARQDFARATETADNIPNDTIRTIAYKKIGSEFARSGVDPSPILNRLQNPVDVARIHAEAGNFEAADRTMAMGMGNREWDTSYVVELAKMKAAAGIYPAFEVVHIKSSIRQDEAKSPICPFDKYEELAIIEDKAGRDPSAFLTHVEEKLDELAQKYPDFSGTSHDYSELAKAYAICGNFERALVVVDKIKGYNPIIEAEVRMKTLAHIAEQQTARGLYQDAIMNAELAVQTIMQAESEPEYLKPLLKSCQTIEVAKLYAIVGKAQGLNGEDPGASFALAIEKVGEISFEGWGAHSLIEIAKAQEAVGIDSAPVFDLALNGLDAIPQGENYDVYDFVYRSMGYEDMAIAQAEFGKIDRARETLSHLENMDTKGDDVKIEVSKVLASIAGAEARLGLSSEEINFLAPEQIREILASDNQLASQAVAYFGLDYKLL